MKKKTLIALVLGVAVLILVNLEVTKSPVRAVLTATDAAQFDDAANQHIEFTINIRLRLRLPNFGAGIDQ